MNVNSILDDCFEDQIRTGFGLLVRNLIPENQDGGIEGAAKKFKENVALAKQARDIAERILNAPFDLGRRVMSDKEGPLYPKKARVHSLGDIPISTGLLITRPTLSN